MTARFSQREVAVPCLLITAGASYQGDAASNYHSLTESINAADRTFLAMTNVKIRSFSQGEVTEDEAASVLVRKDEVLVALSKGEEAEELTSARNMMGDRPYHVIAKAGPVAVKGVLRWPLGTSLQEYLVTAAWQFIPLTDVVLMDENPAVGTLEAGYALINRHAIQAVIELEPPADEAAQPAVESTPAHYDQLIAPTEQHERDLPIDPVTAQAVLLATDVFDDAEPDMLLGLLTELTENMRITQQRVPSGAIVLREGEVGDTLYIVQRGTFEVLTDDGADGFNEIARLKPGEIFGEMAFLGNRRRTATVRAKTDALVLVLPANTWKDLAAHIPNATGRLMRIMAQRGGPPGGGLLSRIR